MLSLDVLDQELRLPLAVALGLLIALFGALLENDDLRAAVLGDDLGGHRRPGNGRAADLGALFGAHEEDVGDLDRLAHGGLEFLHDKPRPGADPELLPA